MRKDHVYRQDHVYRLTAVYDNPAGSPVVDGGMTHASAPGIAIQR